MAKPTLEEMAEAVQAEADLERSVLRHYYQFYPEAGPLSEREKSAASLEAAAHVLRILGTFSDDSRKFVAGLLKRHADGR